MTGLAPAELLAALREVVERGRVFEAPVVLMEDDKGSKCPPVNVSCRGEHWALRLQANDQLGLLAAPSVEKSFRKLPDYLIFAEPPARRRRKGPAPDLLVVVCELKSSEGGRARPGAKRQVQLGKFLAEYLVRLGLFATGKAEQVPELEIVGVTLSPLVTKGGTTPDEQDDGGARDPESDMWLYPLSSGDDLRVDQLSR